MKISLDMAASLLNSGLVVGIPTETVYGLAASINFPKAIEEIFRLKGRPSNNPLIVHLANPSEISLYAKDLPPHFNKLTSAFWPGPLTLVIPVLEDTIPFIARAGLPTVAFRVPKLELTRQLLKMTGPLVMPSANISGKPSATTAEHVENDFGSGFSVLDGGVCEKGLESTILFWNETEWVVARLGALAPEDFEPVLGYAPRIDTATSEQSQPLCPGQLYRHYSPQAKLVLRDLIAPDVAGTIIGFTDRTYSKNSRLFPLGSSRDPQSAAHELYAVLRQLDEDNIIEAVVDMNFPNTGLWLTLRERLQKAAAPNKLNL